MFTDMNGVTYNELFRVFSIIPFFFVRIEVTLNYF